MSAGKTSVPDGLKFDEDSSVWIAGPRGIWVFNSRGDHLGIVPNPENRTHCCWVCLQTLHKT